MTAAMLVWLLAMAQPGDCPALHHLEWPAEHPVWSFCWVSPDESSGIDGSGIELRDVFYKGKPVLKRAGIPLINVQYDPGGCGAYRDWQNTLMNFEAGNAVGAPGSRYAEPAVAPRTMCDHVGTDAGDFEGVAVWKTSEQLMLITQVQAGPYRYVHRWTFALDGTLEGRIAFTSRIDPCNLKPHNHHAYWRLEFAAGNVVEEGPRWSRIRTESSRQSDPLLGGRWRVRSPAAQRGIEIVSVPENGVADAWARADLWVLEAHPDEIDDGGARSGAGGSAVQLDNYLNGERIESPVLWLHAKDRHDGSVRCHFVGPTLRPIGSW